LIDTGSDSLKPFKEKEDSEFYMEWVMTQELFRAVAVALAPKDRSENFDIWDDTARKTSFNESYLRSLVPEPDLYRDAVLAFQTELTKRGMYQSEPLFAIEL
jgi:hypothetical protein